MDSFAIDDPITRTLLVSGRCGSGKTMGVRSAAKESGIRLLIVASDSSDDGGKLDENGHEMSSLSYNASISHWTAIVKQKCTEPTVLVIDDAEALLTATQGKASKAEELLCLSKYAMGLIIISSDTYATPVLRQLSKTTTLTHVRVGEPTPKQVFEYLTQTFPEQSRERLFAIANITNGDVRRALLEVKYGICDDTIMTGNVITRTHSLFDHATAALGIGDLLLPETNLETMMNTHSTGVRRLFHTHYLKTLPPTSTPLDILAEIADAYSTSRKYALTGDYTTLMQIPAIVRSLQDSPPNYISFAGPMGGHEEDVMYKSLNAAKDFAAASRQLELSFTRPISAIGCRPSARNAFISIKNGTKTNIEDARMRINVLCDIRKEPRPRSMMEYAKYTRLSALPKTASVPWHKAPTIEPKKKRAVSEVISKKPTTPKRKKWF